MLATPEIDFRRTPVTLIITALALAIEVVCTLVPGQRDAYYFGWKLGIDFPIWVGEIWRPFTTTLLHGGLIHALFNIYWMTIFGPAVENLVGSFRALALIIVIATASSLAQLLLPSYFGFPVGRMVGLSGVVYGLFGICWMGSRHRTEFLVVCNPMTVQILLGILLLCIPLTAFDILQVANIAHVVGLLMGVLIGLSLFETHRRWLWITLAAVISFTAFASMMGFPTHPIYEHYFGR